MPSAADANAPYGVVGDTSLEVIDGEHIPIEERTEEEVTHIQGVRIAPCSACGSRRHAEPLHHRYLHRTPRGQTTLHRILSALASATQPAAAFSLGPACNEPPAACQWPLTRPRRMFSKRRGIRSARSPWSTREMQNGLFGQRFRAKLCLPNLRGDLPASRQIL
jgi:hypothetical protein